MKVLAIIPAYNEALNLDNVINNLKEKAPNVEYLIINDCSSDNTVALCEEKGLNYLNLPINLGIGGGVQAGYKYGLRNGYDIIVQHDGDGQHDPAFLNDVCQPIEDGRADIVIGSRFVDGKGEGFQSTSSRQTGINILSSIIRLRCGLKIKDVTSGYRAVNREYAQFYVHNYPSDYPEPEAICSAKLAGARIEEVPVVMKERASGKSSINLKRSIYYMIKVSLAILLTRRPK